jgi:hypothetical protein
MPAGVGFGMVKWQVNKKSLQDVLQALSHARVDMEEATEAAVRQAGLVFERAVRFAITAKDHSLDDLAEMGHPYARRHGSIQIHSGDGGGWLADGRNIVHQQSGALSSGLKTTFTRAGSASTFVIELDSSDPVVEYVMRGTSSMLPRDPIGSAADGPRTRLEVDEAVIAVFRRRVQRLGRRP